MGPIRGRQDPCGSHVIPMNLAIWEKLYVRSLSITTKSAPHIYTWHMKTRLTDAFVIYIYIYIYMFIHACRYNFREKHSSVTLSTLYFTSFPMSGQACRRMFTSYILSSVQGTCLVYNPRDLVTWPRELQHSAHLTDLVMGTINRPLGFWGLCQYEYVVLPVYGNPHNSKEYINIETGPCCRFLHVPSPQL